MYTIDNRTLRSSIAIALLSVTKDKDQQEDNVNYYFLLAIEIILRVMNSKERIDDAIDEQIKIYPDAPHLPFIAEVIHDEVTRIKQQFILAGFDRRLKYKLITRSVFNSRFKHHAIVMDLEATFIDIADNIDEDEEELDEVVSANPTLEQLTEILSRW